jgi:hypothetical protein
MLLGQAPAKSEIIMGADVNSNIGLEGISTDIQLFNPFDMSVMTTF